MNSPSILGLYDGAENGCSYYRLVNPYSQLYEMGYSYQFLPLTDLDQTGQAGKVVTASRFDIVSMLRPMVSLQDGGGQALPLTGESLEAFRSLVEKIHRTSAIAGGDLDDDMWSIATHNPARQVLDGEIPERIAATLRELDFVTCSTKHLARQIADVGGVDPSRIHIVPNLVDFDLFDREDWLIEGETEPWSMKKLRHLRLTGQKAGPIVIGLQGGLSHIEDWKIVAPALKAAYERYGDQLRFVIAGGHFDYLKEALAEADAAGHVVWQGWRPFESHSETVITFDINLCPLDDTLFNRSKSAIKFLEGAAAGAASIVSPTVYQDYVQPGKTALVATTAQEWTEALCALIERPAKRQELGRNAHLLARSAYNLETKAYLWNDAYLKVWQQHLGRVNTSRKTALEALELAEMTEMMSFRNQPQQ